MVGLVEAVSRTHARDPHDMSCFLCVQGKHIKRPAMDSSSNTTGSLEEVMGCPNPEQQTHQEKRPTKPVPEQSLKCPRCESTNTKFCYYNNYSLSQPRYFCKSCRRYWTQGGTLRNIPVGGGCRKNNKRTTPILRTPTLPTQLDQITTISSSQVGPTATPHSYYYDGYGCFSGFINQAGPAGFLEILRGGGGGYVENNGMESSGYYGYVEECGNVEFGGGKPELGLECGRDFWGGGVASSFHGLLNSSMI